MGKRRNTARTGDKALYSSRPQPQGTAKYGREKKNHDEVEEEEMLKMFNDDHDNFSTNSDQHPEGEEVQQVLDLGVGGESSSDDDNDSDSDSDDDESVDLKRNQSNRKQDGSDSRSSSSEDDSDDDDDNDSIEEELRKLEGSGAKTTSWGGNKSSYYHGDTADLEIGQDEDDAFVEEEAARDVREQQFEDMDEDDFALPSGSTTTTTAEEKKSGQKKNKKNIGSADDRDDLSLDSNNVQPTHRGDTIQKLSAAAKRKLITKHHPELMSMLSYFSRTVQEYKSTTRVAAAALRNDEHSTEVSFDIYRNIHEKSYKRKHSK